VRVFVSYRRSDVGGYSGRLTDALSARLGVENVFQDVAAIGPGRDFQTEIDRSLAAADAVIAVIGPGWSSAATPTGGRRLFESDDFVRRELSSALAGQLRVVPVLVGGAAMPRAEDLPADLADLTRRQASVLRDESFHADIDRLLTTLRRDLHPQPATPMFVTRGVRVAAAGVLILALVAATAWWALVRGSGRSNDSSPPTGCPSLASGGWREIPVDPSNSTTIQDGTDGSITVAVNAASWREDSAGSWQVVLSTQLQNDTADSLYHEPGQYYRLQVARREFHLACFDGPADPVSANAIGDARAGFLTACPPSGLLSLTIEWHNIRRALAFTNATSPGTCAATPPP